MDVELMPADGERPIGRATLVTEPREEIPDARRERTATMLEFALPEPPSPEEQRLVLGLEAGTRPDVRLRLRASREAALQVPGFDRYWGGGFEATVPVQDADGSDRGDGR
jgi:hypothetical protein